MIKSLDEIAAGVVAEAARKKALEDNKHIGLALIPSLNEVLIEKLIELNVGDFSGHKKPRVKLDPLTVTVYNRDIAKNLDEFNRLSYSNSVARTFPQGANLVGTALNNFRFDPLDTSRTITLVLSNGFWRVTGLSGFVDSQPGRAVPRPIGGFRSPRE